MTYVKRFMDTQQVAEYLDINEKQVYTLIHERELPATKITGKWLFPRHLVDRWLESNVISVPKAGPFLQEERDLLLIAGSDDPLFQELTRLFRKKKPETITLLSRAGSSDGILALRKGLVHIACVHLMDPEGGYSIEHIQEFLGNDIVVVAFARRTQGLIVPPGNPDEIENISDALSRSMRWAVRDVGTGTRALLDRELDNHSMKPGILLSNSVSTGSHLETALAVLTGKAEIGLGIEAAAVMTGCSFLPLRQENFNLIVRKENYFLDPIQELLGLMTDGEFRHTAETLPGYDIEGCGRILNE